MENCQNFTAIDTAPQIITQMLHIPIWHYKLYVDHNSFHKVLSQKCDLWQFAIDIEQAIFSYDNSAVIGGCVSDTECRS